MNTWLRTHPDGTPVYGREQVAHLDHVAKYWRDKHAADQEAARQKERLAMIRAADAKAQALAAKKRDAAMRAILKGEH